jgi:UPF0716 family protein affecting phage T7 exclusion
LSKEEVPFGLIFMEKLFGILLMAIGGVAFYSTYTNIGSAGSLPGLFLAGGAFMMIVGLLLFIAKAEK